MQPISQPHRDAPPAPRLLGPGFVAEFEGLELAGPLSEATLAALDEALVAHKVVAIRGQRLAPEDVLRVSRAFGPLERHVLSQYHHPEYPEIIVLSNVVEDGKPKGLADAGSYWHSDVSYKARPSRATLLHALEVPDGAGDTLFCDMVAAYEALPEDLRHRLDGLRAVHSYAYRQDLQVRLYGYRSPLTAEQRRETPDVSHPAVRTHPVSGRRALYVNPGFTVGFEGLEAAESEALKEAVFAHCLQPQFQHRYRWRAGDVLVWDNAQVMHCATAQELRPDQRRTLLRTIISGDAPF